MDGFNSLQTGKHIQSSTAGWILSLAIVSIPVKRESISKGMTTSPVYLIVRTFQFPSNGKAYPKLTHPEQLRLAYPFQFPSNGKAYPKGERARKPSAPNKVSIPFKRESISKVLTTLVTKSSHKKGFNSLQTGKHIQRLMMKPHIEGQAGRFNSLQTGKHIQSIQAEWAGSAGPWVSIPFKRESISKVMICKQSASVSCWFQFPSNGKAYPKVCNTP